MSVELKNLIGKTISDAEKQLQLFGEKYVVEECSSNKMPTSNVKIVVQAIKKQDLVVVRVGEFVILPKEK